MSERTDVYQEVTDRVLAALDAGTVPWRQPWITANGRPRSMSTRQNYRGVNVMMLGMSGHASAWWGTYRQIAELGGQVRKRERSTMITFWKELSVTRSDEITGEPTAHRVPMLRAFRVFCADQADGLPERFYPQPGAAAEPLAGPQAVADAYLASGKPALHHDVHGQAYYRSDLDEIHMAPMDGHRSAADYYSTLFHEMAHSTGHASRLARDLGNVFGSHAYGKEELAAEMAAAMLQAETGISAETEQNSASYIAGWADQIRADRKLVISAAAAGQRAADLILSPQAETEAGPR